MSNFILYTILCGQSVDKTIVYVEKNEEHDIDIKRIKPQKKQYTSHIPEGVSMEVRSSIKNMFEDNDK